ncbi:hypothetical protein C8Q73DRAFT_812762 [Cubamyces lactineus]|nr:hypothetical protein C8Q73DRAFT_812762 [Cubamyces lactineus]
MSTAIVLPQLPQWFEGRVQAIYKAKTVEEFDEAFDLFVSEHATIRVNGHNIDRDQYKQMIQGEIKSDVSADVTFQGIVTISQVNVILLQTGSVGAFFKAVVYGRIFVFAQRESSTVSSSLNVVYVTMHDVQTLPIIVYLLNPRTVSRRMLPARTPSAAVVHSMADG